MSIGSARSIVRRAVSQQARNAGITYSTHGKLKGGDRLNHGKFAESPEVVKLIGDRLIAGLLFSGYLPAYIVDVNGFMPGFTLEQLREGGAISARAQAADTAPDYSRRIREGVPGITSLPQP